MRPSLAKKAAILARQQGHPEAVAVAMVDPNAEVVEATGSEDRGHPADPAHGPGGRPRAAFRRSRLARSAGAVLTVTADDAESYGLGQVVQRRRRAQGPLRSARQGDPRRRAQAGSTRS